MRVKTNSLLKNRPNGKVKSEHADIDTKKMQNRVHRGTKYYVDNFIG